MEASGVPGNIGSIQSGIAVVNASDNPVAALLELTNLDGTPAGLPGVVIDVPSGGQVTRFINEFFPGLHFQGIARLTAPSGVAVMSLRGRYNERGDFLITTTPPLNETTAVSGDLIFPHIVNGAGWTTQITVFGQASSGRLYLYGEDGTQKSSTSLTLQQ
jgi:hypothetical protein